MIHLLLIWCSQLIGSFIGEYNEEDKRLEKIVWLHSSAWDSWSLLKWNVFFVAAASG